MFLGKLNLRVNINRYATGVVDLYGSPIVALASTWQKWAAIEDKRGGHSVNKGTEVWNYDYKITMRFEASRPLLENDRLEYNGKVLQINSIQIVEENFKQFEVIKCSLTCL